MRRLPILKPARRMGSQCCRDSNTISAEEQLVVTFGSPGDAGEGSSLANRKLLVVAKESASLDPLESPTSPISVVFPETPKKSSGKPRIRGERPAGRAQLLAKKGASGRMQRLTELVPIPECGVKAP